MYMYNYIGYQKTNMKMVDLSLAKLFIMKIFKVRNILQYNELNETCGVKRLLIHAAP